MIFRDCEQLAWDKFVASRNEANFLNSWQWGDIYKALGNKVYRRGLYDDDKLIGVWTAVVKNAKRGKYLEVPGGPLANLDAGLVGLFADDFKKIAKDNSCVFVRIRPQLKSSGPNLGMFKKQGFRQSLMHLHAQDTIIIDLTKSEDELLSNMRQQTRYEVKRFDKLGISLEQSSSTEALKEFFDVQSSTAKRQGFIPPSREFLLALQEFDDSLKIYSAKKDGQLLSMSIVIAYGQEADYFEGASTEAGRKLPGTYGLQWRAIMDAKKDGLTRYNLWGVAPNDNPKHRFAGVTTFKRGFGGEAVSFVPAHDLVIKPLHYALNWAVEFFRKKTRGL